MKSFFNLFSFLADYKKNLFFYFLFILFSTLFSLISFGLFQPFLQLIFENENVLFNNSSSNNSFFININSILGYLVNHLFARIVDFNNKTQALGFICILISICVLLRNVSSYFSMFFLAPVRNGITRKYSKLVYERLIQFPLSYFGKKNKGDLMSRTSNDIGELEMGFVGLLEGIIKEPLTILGILYCMFSLSFELTAYILIFFPISGIIIGLVGKNLKKNNNLAQQKMAVMMGQIEESISGIRIIKAFSAEKKLRNLFDTLIDQLFFIKNRILYKRDLGSPVSETLGIFVVCLVLWFGGKLVLQGKLLDPSAFITYILYFSMIINPLKALTQSFYNAQKGRSAFERLNELIISPIENLEEKNAEIIKEFKNKIEFKKVNFSFGANKILTDISFTIKKGESIAIVGMSGAGKSTLANLIPRFFEIESGEILIDGKNIKNYTLKSLRNLMGIVTQEPIIFNDTIKSNISLGTENPNQETIIQSAKISFSYDYIMEKPNQFDYVIGDRGNLLSGGEKQRLTIARAILKNPPILILDEATSSLDSKSEKLVQQALNSLMENRTSIIIAHRLSTIKHCHKIIVLDKGKIIEMGNHEELINQKGTYFLLNAQYNLLSELENS